MHKHFSFYEVFIESITITVLVMVMMLIIEWLNVRTQGSWVKLLNKNRFLQVFLAALIGLIPGCLGAFTIVSLYTHGFITLGAIVAAFSTTFGDEAFFMFAYIPSTAIFMSLLLIVIATLTGWATDYFFKNKNLVKHKNMHFEIHKIDTIKVDSSLKIPKIKEFSFQRFILSTMLLVYIISLISGKIVHNHASGMEEKITNTEISTSHIHNENCEHDHLLEQEREHQHEHPQKFEFTTENVLFLTLSLFTLFIILTVNEHFLKKHLWAHVIKKHFFKVFLWTFGALLLIGLLAKYFDIDNWIDANKYAMVLLLIIAIFIGIIPESGPHYIFIILFINGTIPFSILLANSIVQDGHGALPLLADSKRSFFVIKAINIIVALIIGGGGLFLGF